MAPQGGIQEMCLGKRTEAQSVTGAAETRQSWVYSPQLWGREHGLPRVSKMGILWLFWLRSHSGQAIPTSRSIPVPSGRTHRSNQVSAPEYVFLISELAGERRFASIVAKRLESLVSAHSRGRL